jgi:hypothetical protein
VFSLVGDCGDFAASQEKFFPGGIGILSRDVIYGIRKGSIDDY